MTAVEWGSPAARRVLLMCVLGSSMAFLDSTVVNVALPHIRDDLGSGLAGLQWIVDSYLVALSALVLVGGALGDRYGRRKVFLVGVYGFTAASLVAGIAPGTGALVAARAGQGVAGALLVPGSLALLSSAFDQGDRARAVGAWSGLTGVAGAVGPLLGGVLVDTLSWRWVFLINLPVAAGILLVARGVPEVLDDGDHDRLDLAGGAVATAAIGLTTAGLIEREAAWAPTALVAGGMLAVAFVVVERRRRAPMVPPSLFASRQFSGANGLTLALYAALGVAMFLVVLNLQQALGYSALEAGAALVPMTVLLMLLSSRAGAFAQRVGPTLPMTVGPLVAAAGVAWLGLVEPGDSYATAVLPPVTLLGLGLAATVAPLTAVVMAAVDEHHLGVASGVNNAVARLASLLGVAAVPALAGVDLEAVGGEALSGYRSSLLAAAVLCVAGAAVAALTVRRAARVQPTVQAGLLHPCSEPCRGEREQAAAA